MGDQTSELNDGGFDFTETAGAKRLREARTSLRSAVHAELDRVLADPFFSPGLARQPGVDPTELAYRRFKRFAKTFPISRDDVLESSERLIAAHERTACIDGTMITVLSIHYSLCLGSVLELGEGRPDLDELIGELERADSIGVFLVTEVGYGNNVADLETRADFDPERGEFVLTSPTPASRKYMPNTGYDGLPKIAIVMARLFVCEKDHGVFPFIVRISDENGVMDGVRVIPLGPKPGYDLDNAVTIFNECRLPRESLLTGGVASLGAEGDFHSSLDSPRQRFLYFMDRVQSGRVLLTTGIARRMNHAVVTVFNYSAQRESFSPMGSVPIARFRNVQNDLVDALGKAHAARFAMQGAAKLLRTPKPERSRAAFRAIAALKATTSYAAAEAISICRERGGEMG